MAGVNKVIIEEILSDTFEEFGIDCKGKISEMAEIISSSIDLMSDSYSPSSIGHKTIEEDESKCKSRIINALQHLPFCKSCGGKGVGVDGVNKCYFCDGTGRLLKSI